MLIEDLVPATRFGGTIILSFLGKSMVCSSGHRQKGLFRQPTGFPGARTGQLSVDGDEGGEGVKDSPLVAVLRMDGALHALCGRVRVDEISACSK